MVRNSYKVFIFSVVLFFILIINFPILALNQTNSADTITQLKLSPESTGTNIINSLPELAKFSQSSDVQNYAINQTIKYNFTLSNQTRGYAITLNSTINGQIGYFWLNQTLSSGNFSIFLIDSNDINRSSNIEYQNIPYSALEGTLGEISFVRSMNWLLEINTTYNFQVLNKNKLFHLQLTVYLPSFGYSPTNPVSVYDYSHSVYQVNNTVVNYNVLFPYQTVYFKLNIETNRRVDFVINEITPYVLENSIIRFYQLDPSSGNPSLLNDPPINNGPGSYNYSWVSNILYDSNTFWIKIQLFSPLTNPGNFSITFSFQQSGYSFDSAIKLNTNQSYTYDQNYRDRYSIQKIYFKFQIPYSDVNISFFAKSIDPLILVNSKFKFYYQRPENPLFDVNEIDSNIRGSVNTNFIPSKAGIYYIEYIPAVFAPTGSWSIGISYVRLPTFNWSFNYILFDIFYLLVFPVIILYVKLRNNSEHIIEWEVDQNSTDVFKTLSKNINLSPKMEVPFQKILLLRKNMLIRDMIIDLVPVRLSDEDKSLNDNFNSSIGFRFKNTIDSYMSIGVIVWLIGFWFLNILFFELSKQTFLPYRVADINAINDLFYYLLFPVTLLLLILYFYKEIYLKVILNEIQSSVKDSSQNRSITTIKTNLFDSENLMKNLAYVRVLWNQAIKAFNEKNYSLFIIRADNSVKKLLETRFQQLIGTIDEKLEFPDIIEAVREQGFDIPSTKKIEYFRKVRNKVVHSSHMLDEKTAIETFTYYSKFLGRLGLRT